jgi:heterotetrameric sarcosine oxidase gamma subunit
MPEFNPIFRKAIAVPDHPGDMAASSDERPALSDLTGVQVTLIQGEAGAILKKQFSRAPAKPGDLVEAGEGLLACLTPKTFYLFAKTPGADLPAASALDDLFAQANVFAHAADYTHGTAALRLVGPDAPEILSKICGLDFHDSVFPTMRVAQSSAAKINTLIARYDDGQTPAYFLHISRPLGQYFWDIVWDAGQEFGLMAGVAPGKP